MVFSRFFFVSQTPLTSLVVVRRLASAGYLGRYSAYEKAQQQFALWASRSEDSELLH